MRWSDAFHATGEGPAVFLVVPAHRAGLLSWAGRQPVPTVSRRDLHGPAVEDGPRVDGGVLRLHGHPAATLPAGLRVVGFAAMRLIAADLGLGTPIEPLPGERSHPDGPDELRRAHHGTDRTAPDVVEQAELLASCTEVSTLRWVATALCLDRIAWTGAPADPCV